METGSGSGASGSSDSLNGLKFGKKIYFEDVGSGSSGSGGSGSSSKQFTEPPPKKGKGVVHGGAQHPPRCQVEGCNIDLTGAKAYYCRHKVCGMHSKSPKVVVSGIEQRFCQQCSRFHLLHEFDQGKRSCRRRLAGHNERRRKPPPGPLSPSFGRLSSSHEDNSGFRSFLMDFTYPRPTATSRDLWPTARASDRVAGSGPWHLSFDAPHSAAMAHQYMQPPAHFTAPELPHSECLGGATDSSCALSLLSNQPWGGPINPRNRGPTISGSNRVDTGPSNQHMTGAGSNFAITNPWGFKGHGSGNSGNSHEIQHDTEFGHFDSGGDQFSGELELALQGNRQYPNHGPARSYDQSGGVMHWSL